MSVRLQAFDSGLPRLTCLPAQLPLAIIFSPPNRVSGLCHRGTKITLGTGAPGRGSRQTTALRVPPCICFITHEALQDSIGVHVDTLEAYALIEAQAQTASSAELKARE